MALYTITTKNGLPDFIRLFTEAVVAGKRFKTVNFPESEKDSITSLGDYNFYTINRQLPILTSGNNWTVILDDAYVLPPNVVLPSQVAGESLFGLLDSGRVNGGNLGALLMAIQHIAGAFPFDTTVTPNKSTIDGFIGRISVITRRFMEAMANASPSIDIPLAEATANFVLRGDVVVPTADTAGNQAVLGNPSSAVNNFAAFFGATRSFNIQYPRTSGGPTFSLSLGASRVLPYAGQLVTWQLERSGNDVTFSLRSFTDPTNVLEMDTETRTDWGTIQVSRLFTFADLYFGGIQANINFVSGFTQVGNLTGNPTYNLDDPLGANSNVIVNDNAVLGSELYSFANVGVQDPSSSATEIPGFNSPGSTSTRSFIDIPGGTAARAVMCITLSTGGTIFERDGTGGTGNIINTYILSAGDHEVLLGSGVTTILFIGSFSYDVTGISIKEAPGYGQAFNIAAPVEYTQDGTDWVNAFWPNLLEYSQDASNNNWIKSSGVGVGADVSQAPDGTMTADRLTPTTGGAFVEYFNDTTSSQSTEYTQSYFVKFDGLQYVQIIGPGSVFGSFYVNFDIQNGTVTAESGATGQITPANNGYYRVSVTRTALIDSTFARLALNFIKTATTTRGQDEGAFSGSDSILVWGAQFEENSSVTPYIATTDVVGRKLETA